MDNRSKAAWFFRTLTIFSFVGLIGVISFLIYYMASSEQRAYENRALLCTAPVLTYTEYCDAIRTQLDKRR